MAKAREIPGLTAGLPFGEAAARSVAVRTDELFEHSAGVLDMTEIEGVHAMRVATRRLRAVLELYAPCFPKDELRPVLRDVKALAAALGARRDPDVELLALEEFLQTAAPDERVGVERFVARTRAQQEQGNAILAAELRRMGEIDLEGRLRALAEHAIR
jgi:CHAD domain-containing protein